MLLYEIQNQWMKFNQGKTFFLRRLFAFYLPFSDDELWVNLYGSNMLDTRLPDGFKVKLTRQNNYPWQGTIKITVEEIPVRQLSVLLRIPGRAGGSSVGVNRRLISNHLKTEQYFQFGRL